MIQKKRFPSCKLLIAAMVVLFSGCASAYHDYADCCIPYCYCRPRPLPYVSYQGCHCPLPVGTQHSGMQAVADSASGAEAAVLADASASARDDAATSLP